MSIVRFSVFLIDAAAADEAIEDGLIGPLGDRETAFAALDVACGLLEGMLVGGNWVLLVEGQELSYGARSGWFLANCLGWWHVFNGVNRQALVYPSVACMALVATTVWLPLVLAGDFLVLLRGAPCWPHWFLMKVVLRVFVDLLQPGCCMLVDLETVLIEGSLDGVRPFPSRWWRRCGSLPGDHQSSMRLMPASVMKAVSYLVHRYRLSPPFHGCDGAFDAVPYGCCCLLSWLRSWSQPFSI